MKNFKQKSGDEDSKKREFKPAPITAYMIPVKKLITFHPETDIMEVLETLLEHKITGGPVLNDKKEVVGLIDDKDCLRVLFDIAYHNQPIQNTTVAHYMTNVMKTISVNADVVDVADIFLKTIYKRLLVVDEDGKLVGQISRQDILMAIHDLNTGPT